MSANPTIAAMAAALQVVWPDRDGLHYLGDEGMRLAVYRAHGFSDEEIGAYDMPAFARERQRREQAQCG